MVNYEIKSQLAKLLATEDIVVEHKKVSTACFNVHTRVLTLPMWNTTSSVFDMLVGHEVGHALYTPDTDFSAKIPKSFINVTEDARIEKLMKRRYGGINKTFRKGYAQLVEDDFFEIKDVDISKMNLADRANLWFKIGTHVDIPIKSDVEMQIIDMIANAETFEDAMNAADVLYKYCKEEKDTSEKLDQKINANTEHGSGGDSTEKQDREWFTDSDPEEDHRNDRTRENESDLDTPSYESDSGESTQEPEVHTDTALSDNIKDLIDDSGKETVYLQRPKFNLDEYVISVDDISQRMKTSFDCEQKNYSKMYAGNYNIYEDVDRKFNEFKKSAQKEVNYLVKEFECKKSASQYARSGVSRTGVLDCNKLHTYKHNEDIFRKVTTLPDGKNHGLIFFFFWSGSMANVMIPTIKQLFNLVWFCKKTNIPFEVFAFTNDWVPFDGNGQREKTEENEYEFYIDRCNNLMTLLNSHLKSKDLDECMKNIWRVVYSFTKHVDYHAPFGMNLSGTPLNESLLSFHQIIPNFVRQNKVEKVHSIILTDGEAHAPAYNVEIKSLRSTNYMGKRSISPIYTYLRDRKIGKTYQIKYEYNEFTQTLIENLKDNFPNVNFIGFRIIDPKDVSNFIKRYDADSLYSKNNKTLTLKNTGYDAYFVLSSGNLESESEFRVDDEATKTQIKRAFVKSLKSKKVNKKILNEFVELVV